MNNVNSIAWRPEMDDKVFQRFRDLVYSRSGINLGPAKKSLVCARVAKRLRILNLENYSEYLEYLAEDSSGEEVVQLLDVISTNVTSFFREPEHFKVLNELFSQWIQAGQNRIRIWSCACSTGEEPYTIAVSLLDKMKDMGISPNRVDIRILATDISTTVLNKCRAGRYQQDKTKGLSKMQLNRYFDLRRDSSVAEYVVKPELKTMVLVRRLNLSRPPFPMKGPMDAVFCRNVMIYFDNDVRMALLSDIYRLLKPDGLLFVGHAESLAGMMMKQFRNVRPSVYKK